MIGLLSIECIVFIAVVISLYGYLKISKYYHWFDHPDESRKMHNQAIPTSAGLVFMLPVALMSLFLPLMVPLHHIPTGLMLLVLMLMGGVDDFKPISVKIRLIIVTVISVLLVYYVFKDTNLNLLLLGVYVLGLIWWLNLYNFMDGADGMTALHAVITALGYLAAFFILSPKYIPTLPYIALFILSLVAFLLFNFPKARLFMGDSGSLSVAFVLALLALSGLQLKLYDELFIISFHLCFIVDATLTLFVRLKHKHKLSQAHSLHYFQLLIKSGHSHAFVSIVYAFVTALLVSLTLFLQYKQIDFTLRLVILLIETSILSLLWFNFHKKTKFKHFVQ
jgi:UDP-N-acetylmuramyl pentapeptide phosphotransferase/UDP-N-acetylglucosamine-1-phosphate transferase